MKKQPLKYRLNIVGASLIIFLLIRTYLPPIMAKLGFNRNIDLWLCAYIILVCLSCIIPIAFIENMCDYHPYLFGKRENFNLAPVIVMSSMLLFIVVAVLNQAIIIPLEKMGLVFPRQQIPNINTPLDFVLSFIFFTIAPAIFEELFMRGVLLNLLMPYGRKFAIFSTAFIFMVMHNSLGGFIPVFFAGVTLACVYLYTDNIYISMLVHFANNTYTFLIMYAQQSVNGISAISFSVYLIAFIIACGVASIINLYRRGVNIYSAMDGDTKPVKFGRLFASPVLVLAIICCLISVGEQMYKAMSV